ncbi:MULTISPECIES: hypothetical protein [unclassified Streptomyces]|uniref:hypothetical protein n=1 Tax=unclassified Streptomyces TaxID=2593676 RepID=UPI0015E1A189|nr:MULTISPECIES: hypothetical protein [unclassified Streptomyces]
MRPAIAWTAQEIARSRLLALGGETPLGRVDISHVDQLGLRIVREAEPGSRKK